MTATATVEGPEASAADGGSAGFPWWHPGATVQRVSGLGRSVEKRLARQPLARLSLAAPRTARYLVGEMLGENAPGVPSAKPTPGLAGQVLMDESIMALVLGPGRFPRRADYERVSDELDRAHRLFDDSGWLEDPASFHVSPPVLTDPAVSRGWALGHSYERLWWPSGFEPRLGVPGTDRWLAFEANRTASAWVLRHRDDVARPWVVCVHGFGTGATFMDLFSFRAAHLHEKLGLNVAAITLPLHGNRRVSRVNGDEFLGFEFMNSVHGLTQAVWDVRRLLSWVRGQSPTGVGLFGVSLGGLVTSLVAAFESELDLALAGIPIANFPELIEHHAPRHLQMRSIEHHILDGTAQDIHRVVSPLTLPVAVAPEARAMFAGLGDRLATTDQAKALWRHWDEPETCWFPGNHVGYLWSKSVWEFVDAAMVSRGLSV